jgi:hypothetical protein
MRLSVTIQNLLKDYAGQPVTLGVLLGRTGAQGFGMISGLLALPMLIPLPLPFAGFSTVLGAGIVVLGLQMACGCQHPRLPPAITRLTLSPALSQQILKNLNRVLRPLEHLTRSRLLQISRNRLLCRFLGLCLAWNAVLMGLPLPIPMTNLLPAYSILALVIGLLEEDGLFFLVGYGMTAATTTFFASLANLIWKLLSTTVQRVAVHYATFTG